LTVTKVVENDNGGKKSVSDFPLFVGSTSVTSGVQATFNAGSYTVSETNQNGYQGTISGDCASDGSITLYLGDVKSCTITNKDQKADVRLPAIQKWVIHDRVEIDNYVDPSPTYNRGTVTFELYDATCTIPKGSA